MKDQNNTWILKGGRAFTPAPFALMGIVNMTPDSFYDGSKHNAPEAALKHARTLWQEGAHILDLGAESSRPGAEPVSAEEELKRLLPVLLPLVQDGITPFAENLPPAPLLSVDTYHADTAEAVLQAGAHIINDISACLYDPALMDVVAEHKPGYVLMHAKGLPRTMQANPHYENVVDEVMAFFEERLQALTTAGLPESHIVLDPGIGFGKSVFHNMELLRHMEKFAALGRPLLMGLSMKSLFAGLLDLPPGSEHMALRAAATQTATALLAARGIVLHRVHHVAETLRTLRIVEAFQL